MSDPKLNLEEIDVKRLQNLHREYQQNYDAKVNHMTQQFRKCMDELKRDHEKQMSELNTVQSRVIKNHESVNRFHDESLRAVVDEKQDIVSKMITILKQGWGFFPKKEELFQFIIFMQQLR